ncbi:MAG: glycerophosphodiester phosphodiesterase [Candidatus Marinimicrobia bacterium]|nr:glycerophosphodiester phosphodiesterase [Candidatus Neomarinimicrobiota bacterium]
MHKTTIIAHRGASGYAPENTLAAFKAALDMKVDAVECDVQICRSGEVVVFHDRRLKRITGERGKVKRKKLACLRRLDAGNGEHIPTLKEVLNLLDARLGINVELKSKRCAVSTAQIIRNSIRTGSWKPDDFFVSSMRYREIRRFHEIYPEIPTALLYNKKPRRLKKRIKVLGAFAVHLKIDHIRQARIQRIHNYNLKVYVWTVDDLQTANKLRSEGVDGFFSNYPDRLIKKH